MILKKTRTSTEIQQIHAEFPDYDITDLTAEYSTTGEIINIETTDKALIAYLKSKGFK